MRLIEGIRGEFLPVGPYLLKHLRVVTVLHTTIDELGLHGIYDVLLLLTHSLSERIALTTGEVSQLAREQHHLLLIDRDAISILQILLHARDVIGNRLQAVLALDERRDIVHWAGTIEGIHGYEVLKDRWMQLTQIFLHAGTLKLERADSLSALVELVCQLIVDGYALKVDVYTLRQLHILHGLLLLREGLQSKEVHLYQASRLNNMSVILCHGSLHIGEVRIVGSTHRHMVAYRIAADDEAAGMNADISHRTLQHLCIFDGVGLLNVSRGFGLGYGRHRLDDVGQIHLQTVRQAVGDGLAERIGLVEREFLHTGHILDGILRGHSAVGDDMCTVLMPVLVHHPAQHLAATVIIEVGIDIRQGDTVRVKETLEQQVVLQGVKLRDAQAIGHHAARSAATSRSHPYAELLAGRIDEVLHNKEVPREAHRLHDMQLKADAVVNLLVNTMLLCPCRQLTGLKSLNSLYLAIAAAVEA